MRVSNKAEYACVAMLELAAAYAADQPVRIKAIAESQGISQHFLVQILLQLKTAGLVASVRGASGGYQLARAPESVSLAEVINAIDARRRTWRSALHAPERSAVASTLLDVWKDLQDEEQRRLESLSLAELLRRAQASNTLSYQI